MCQLCDLLMQGFHEHFSILALLLLARTKFAGQMNDHDTAASDANNKCDVVQLAISYNNNMMLISHTVLAVNGIA